MGILTTKTDNTQLIKQLGNSILNFTKSFPLASFQAGEFKQHPSVTLLTCSDSRMPVEIFGSSFNHIFAVENIGNQFRTAEGSILYGLFHLHTPLMIIAGHTDCGAIKAADSNFLAEPLAIRNELSVVKDSLEKIITQSGVSVTDNQDLRHTQLSELNVDMQIDLLLSDEHVFNLVGENKLLIIGVMIDLHNVYAEGYGQVYTVNINGETDTDILQSFTDLGVFAAQAKRFTRY
ncbi:MAG: carbonic anhydrase [Syntrophomonadaceae bacterium]|nr:carbonic anhydrase [Syntrophomonadaceae bacterium]